MIEMVVYDQETAWQLEKTLNSPNEPQSGIDRLRTASFSRQAYLESDIAPAVTKS